MSTASVHRLDGEREGREHSGGNGGNGRLRAVEDRLTRLEAKFEYLATKEDVGRLETELKHLATKEDVKTAMVEIEKNRAEIEKNRVEIQKIKVWVLLGVLGGMATAALIALGIMRLWLGLPS